MPSDLQSSFTVVEGLTLHDRCGGCGPPIVFVHGLAVSGRYFEPLASQLAQRYHVRVLDLPGFGRSDDPAGVLDVAGLADFLALWLRANGLENATLVGNSAGCQYIADCVARHRDLNGPVVLIGPTTDPQARTAPAQILRWLRTGRYRDITQLPIVIKDCRDAGVRRVVKTFRAILSHEMEEALPHVHQPALVLRGANDPIVPRRWASQVAWLLPEGELVEVPGAHVVNFTRPQQVAAAIRDFLDRQSA